METLSKKKVLLNTGDKKSFVSEETKKLLQGM
jgi:hypothetical protein